MLILMCCLSSSAWAGSLYINGVKVDGLTSIQLHNVDLEIDDKGDVHVTAKGYTVNVTSAPNAHKSPAPPSTSTSTSTPTSTSTSTSTSTTTSTSTSTSTKYYVTMTQVGDPQWDLDVFVNGEFVRRFHSGNTEAPLEVTRLMKPGDNTIRFRAVKQDGPVRSIQPGEFLQVGIEADAKLVTGRHELTHIYKYKRTAAETGMFDDSVTVTIR